jgi:uncharacterized protein (DUF1684 family)
MSTEDFAKIHAAWAASRLAALKAGDGWLNLTDRIEVGPGRHTVGRAEGSALRISAGPDHLGVLDLAPDGSATFETGGDALPFAPVPDNPPRVEVGGLLLEISALEGQAALRVRDLSDPRIAAFAGIPTFPLDQAWRIVAAWQALPEAEVLGIGTIAGIDTSVKITHHAHFRHDGQDVTLIPTHWKGGKPMFVIRDATSGRETYGASRFLIGEVAGDSVVLDFNRAFNPPCAFTEFAICPLPPRQNILPFAIRVGEKAVAH